MNPAFLLMTLRRFMENIAPGPETLARREAMDMQSACCALLMEVARLDGVGAEQKHDAVVCAMREQFAIPEDELTAMIASASQPGNRLTSYFSPVALINKRCASDEKAKFIERLWRVAMADGRIDMYEEQLVRTLADLLYVPHADFILAKHRAQDSGGMRPVFR